MKSKVFLVVAFSVVFYLWLPKEDSSASLEIQNTTLTKTQQSDGQNNTEFNCDYMGETPPGNVPVKFALGIISTKVDDSCFEISPSGKEMSFERRPGGIMLTTQNSDGSWSEPNSVHGKSEPTYTGGEPNFSRDGNILYFNSRQSFPGAKAGLNLWYMDRTNDGWSEAKYFKSGPVLDQNMHAASAASNGNIYVTGVKRLKFVDGEYQKAELLKPNIKGAHPFIASDESYMIFDKRAPKGYAADLYITFKKVDGAWTDPEWLGDVINSNKLETNAFVTPDGKYMFFTRAFDVFWVKADFINEMKEIALK